MATQICKPTHGRFKDIEGQRFSRLLVLNYAGMNRDREALWYCQCDCGITVVVKGSRIRRGVIKSCGCLKRDGSRKSHPVHGMHQTAEYQAWADMLQRCENPKVKAFHRYGGRGITVCERWHEFPHFIADMGLRPRKGLTLERVDNSQGYHPGNCEWRSWSKQSRNRVSNRLIVYQGRTKCLTDLAKDAGISPVTLSSRLSRGWSVDRAVTEAVHCKGAS